MPRPLFLVPLVLLAGGCAVNVTPNRNTGGDGERFQAQPQELNKIFMDSVDFDDGDATDWRYVVIGQRGLLSVTCHFDNPQAKTSVNVRDAVGNVLAAQYHNGQPRQEATVKVKPGVEGTGKYFVEVNALEEGAISQYSCEANFEAVVW